MKIKINSLSIIFLLLCEISIAQIGEYRFYRKFNGVTDQWHSISIPPEMYSNIKGDLSDIRIFGITNKKDTIEVPYILELTERKNLKREIAFKTLNTSVFNSSKSFVFELSQETIINSIELKFKEDNFDWLLELQGSNDLKDWSTILNNYRITAVHNEKAEFNFSTLNFTESKYKYYRVIVKNQTDVDLITATITKEEEYKGKYTQYKIVDTKSNENKIDKSTELIVQLENAVPVSDVQIIVKDSFDYYRPISISYLLDSVKTEKGYFYNYNSICDGMLNSHSENKFLFSSTITKFISVKIFNENNKPLSIKNIIVSGPKARLIARFTDKAKYFLAYGNKNAYTVNYDIENFKSTIPKELKELALQKEEATNSSSNQSTTPFMNKNWLWAVMGIVIALLGWFTMSMIRGKKQD